MKSKLFIFLLPLFFCCKNQRSSWDQPEFKEENNLQLTFLVFDAKKLSDFLETYDPFLCENSNVQEAIHNLSRDLNYEKDKATTYYDNNTKIVSSEDIKLSKSLITKNSSCDSDHTVTVLEYFFFQEVLPDKFQYKWPQDFQGNFEFNATFLSLLRKTNTDFDNLIYENINFEDIRLQNIFKKYIVSDISPSIAKGIKETIQVNSLFGNKRFQRDKDIFIEFLNDTIEGKWKLVLLDWN